MYDCIVDKMRESDIPSAIELWVMQYERYCGGSEPFPRKWAENTVKVREFLSKKVRNEMAVTAKRDDRLLGYMAYDVFSQNGEESAFCPSIAHAAVEAHKEGTYLSLYRHVSEGWVDRRLFSHYCTIFYNDVSLRGILYDLGFGSYVVDAFACADSRVAVNSTHEVTKAGVEDAGVLHAMV